MLLFLDARLRLRLGGAVLLIFLRDSAGKLRWQWMGGRCLCEEVEMEDGRAACLQAEVKKGRGWRLCVFFGAVATHSFGYSKGNINMISRL